MSRKLDRVSEKQDIDFGMEMEPLLETTAPIITLTPPKLPQRKRSYPMIRPDTRIELSDEVWKRQRRDPSFMVVKRPPLPLIDLFESEQSFTAIPQVVITSFTHF